MRAGLTLGPVYYLWQAEAWRDFYFAIADAAPVDTVVIGEVVCSKRMHFHAGLVGQVVERLLEAGKAVRFASLALVTLPRERQAMKALAGQDDFPVEVNDLSLLPALAGRPSFLGPLVNVYSAGTARAFAAMGIAGICLPPELPLASMAAIAAGQPGAELEAFVFGRAPLALSARCAHARVNGHSKDNCQFVCGNDPDGLVVETLDGQDFLALNGIQTLSSTYMALLGDLPALQAAGIARFRLSPQHCDMVRVAQLHRDVLDGQRDPEAAMAELAAICGTVPLANGFLHGAPGAERVPLAGAAR